MENSDSTAYGESDAATCSAVGGEFYNGLEWFACWLLDHKEGDTITEELLRPWAYEAWKEHLVRQNATVEATTSHNSENENGN